VTRTVTVDIAGARIGGAARFAAELRGYLARTGRQDVRIVGDTRRVDAAWLIQREIARPSASRRVALNNVSFVGPGGEKWALLRNALHFLTDAEASRLVPALRSAMRRQAAVVRLSARRADVLVVPCTAMAERVIRAIPEVTSRVVVRLHPTSADPFPRMDGDPVILVPVVIESYKQMDERLSELIEAVRGSEYRSIRVLVTATPNDLPSELASDPRLELVGRLDYHSLRKLWARSRAIYFPTGLESFGYPLAEARVCGRPVIARDTPQNREIAGPALCGFDAGSRESLRHAVGRALTIEVDPDPHPFDPDAYFEWLLGAPA
jgi:glycosyltransferase involved in cell wall biosynthesis